MKRLRADEKSITLEIEERERDALLHVLGGYPAVPSAHHSVSKSASNPEHAEHQRLLDEALAEQRAGNKRRLDAWVKAPDRLVKAPAGFELTILRDDVEWLLQVLNDVRVGNWLLLGSPEITSLQPDALKEEQLPHWFAMELSGYFQAMLLEALEN